MLVEKLPCTRSEFPMLIYTVCLAHAHVVNGFRKTKVQPASAVCLAHARVVNGPKQLPNLGTLTVCLAHARAVNGGG